MSTADLRVLLLSHGHPALSFGGGEVASFNLHKGLKASGGVSSFYLARTASPMPRHAGSAFLSFDLPEDELLYHADDYDHLTLSNANTGDIERDLIPLVHELQPDIVHFHHVIGFGLETVHAMRRALPKAVMLITLHEFLALCHHHGQMVKRSDGSLCRRSSPIDCHLCFPDIGPASFLRRQSLIRASLELFDHFISPSAFLADRFAAWGLPGGRMSVIENGLDIEVAALPRHVSGPEQRRGNFAFFGQLMPQKGIEILLDAVNRVPGEIWGPDARLMIFGNRLEKQAPAFRERVEKLLADGKGRARIYGPYQNTEMGRLMASADWVVVPSIWWENSPVVIQEAFFHRRPVITSNIGGMAEKVRDRIDGLHFRVGSAEDLADRLAECLTTPGLWNELRDGIAPPPSHVDCAGRHIALYRRLLDEGAAGRAVAAVASIA